MNISKLSSLLSNVTSNSQLSMVDLKVLLDELKIALDELKDITIHPGSTKDNPVPSNIPASNVPDTPSPFWVRLPITLDTVNATQQELDQLLATAEKAQYVNSAGEQTNDVVVKINGPLYATI